MDFDDDAPPDLVEAGTVVDDDLPPSDKQIKVPITIVTGYLGAGKTTLLNYILTAQHGKKIAVIMNGLSHDFACWVWNLMFRRVWRLSVKPTKCIEMMLNLTKHSISRSLSLSTRAMSRLKSGLKLATDAYAVPSSNCSH